MNADRSAHEMHFVYRLFELAQRSPAVGLFTFLFKIEWELKCELECELECELKSDVIQCETTETFSDECNQFG